MNILLCGASGFVGRHLEAALLAAGHEVVRGVRQPRRTGDIAIDYRDDINPDIWLPRLAGIEAVVNAIGVLRDSPAQPMTRLHDQAPRALFAAAAQGGVKRIVQISALGAGTGLNFPYMKTKQAADDFLQTLNVDWAILRPSLIFGMDGESTRMFTLLARMPLLMLPEGGAQMVQPVHIDDLAQAVVNLLGTGNPPLRSVIECVGPEPVSLGGLIASYRMQRGGKVPKILAVPGFMLKAMAWLGDRIPAMPVGSDTLAMLDAGSTGNAEKFSNLLGRTPRSYQSFLRE